MWDRFCVDHTLNKLAESLFVVIIGNSSSVVMYEPVNRSSEHDHSVSVLLSNVPLSTFCTFFRNSYYLMIVYHG